MMKVTRAFAINLNSMLARANLFFREPYSQWFRFFVSHNYNVTENERKETAEAFPSDPGYIAAEQQKKAKYAEIFKSPKDTANAELQVQYDKACLEIMETNKAAYDAEATIKKCRAEFEQEEVELDIRKVDLKYVPELINGPEGWQVWNLIRPLISLPAYDGIKVKRAYAVNLNVMLGNAHMYFKEPVNNKFRNFVTHNYEVTENERKEVFTAFPADPGFIEAEELKKQARASIFKKPGDFANPALNKEFEDKCKEIQEDYKAAYEAEATIDKSRDDFCSEEIELGLSKIDLANVPEMIDGPEGWRVWNLMLPLINDPNPEETATTQG